MATPMAVTSIFCFKVKTGNKLNWKLLFKHPKTDKTYNSKMKNIEEKENLYGKPRPNLAHQVLQQNISKVQGELPKKNQLTKVRAKINLHAIQKKPKKETPREGHRDRAKEEANRLTGKNGELEKMSQPVLRPDLSKKGLEKIQVNQIQESSSSHKLKSKTTDENMLERNLMKEVKKDGEKNTSPNNVEQLLPKNETPNLNWSSLERQGIIQFHHKLQSVHQELLSLGLRQGKTILHPTQPKKLHLLQMKPNLGNCKIQMQSKLPGSPQEKNLLQAKRYGKETIPDDNLKQLKKKTAPSQKERFHKEAKQRVTKLGEDHPKKIEHLRVPNQGRKTKGQEKENKEQMQARQLQLGERKAQKIQEPKVKECVEKPKQKPQVSCKLKETNWKSGGLH